MSDIGVDSASVDGAPGEGGDLQEISAPAVPRGRLVRLVWLVAVLAVVGLLFRVLPEAYTLPVGLALNGILVFIGLLALFAWAAGILRPRSFGTQAETALSLLDSAPAGRLVCTDKGTIIYANRAYRQMTTGQARGRILPIERVFSKHDDMRERIYRLIRAANEGAPWEEEVRLQGGASVLPGAWPGRGPQPAWLQVSVRPCLTARGDRLTVWTLEDVTKRLERQEAAFQKIQRIIDYFDGAPAGFYVCDEEGQLLYVNSTLAGWLDMDMAQTSGGALNIRDIITGGEGVLAAGDASGGIDVDMQAKDGSVIPVRVIQARDRAESGNLVRALVLDRRAGSESDEERRSVEVRFARFFNHAPIGIAMLDGHGVIHSANDVFAELVGETALHGRRCVEFLDAEDGVRFSDQLKNATLAGLTEPAVELHFPENKNARVHICRLEDSANGDATGQSDNGGQGDNGDNGDNGDHGGPGGPGDYVVYAIDTTEQNLLEVQFAQSHKMQAVGQLAGGVAHDFNNMLTAIIGFSDLLLTRCSPSDPSFKDVQQIKQSANRAANLVRQLLAFSRQQTLQPTVLGLSDVLADISNMLGRLLGENVELKMSHGRDLWFIKADRTQFDQVILNLAVNARDAMPDGGTLSISTRNISEEESKSLGYSIMPAGEYILCEARDIGIGIQPENLGKVFEPFFSTKDVGEGTGLGLSTVYGIIKQTGGFIFVESELGKGTVFRIYLPRHIPDEAELAAEVAAPPPPEAAPDLTGMGTILLVEDEDAVRTFAARALSSRGYTVLEADTGETALEQVEAYPGEIDLVVSDVVMPNMDGPSMLTELRKRRPNTKVIFISGYAEEAFKKNLDKDEEFAFLAKPFTLKQLASRVKEVIGH